MKKKALFLFLVSSIITSALFSQTSKNEFSSKLLPMVGKKVTVTLKEGEVLEGTLWDFEADYIILKIKKSLIYSQSVKYDIDQLEFLEDENGTKVSFVNESKPTAIFFSMEDAQEDEDNAEAYNLTQAQGENGLQIITSSIQAQKENQPKTVVAEKKPEVQKTYRTKQKKTVLAKQKPAVVSKPPVKIQKSVEKINSIAKVSAPSSKKTTNAIKPKKESKVSITKASSKPIKPKIEEKVVEYDQNNNAVVTANQEVLVLRYQLMILFAVVGLLAIVMITAKAIGLKGSTYGKHTLFPSKLTKLEGSFGIIDQGIDDGVYENPDMLAFLFDVSGVNTSSAGIGHDLIAVLDENTADAIVLNEYYESELDSYERGSIRYPFSELDEGRHSLRIKVWDVNNNSTDSKTEFVVASGAELALEHVLNYPNPFTTHTDFYFSHNQPGQDLSVRVQVFTVSGKVVKTIDGQYTSEGFRIGPIAWDGRDEYGDRIGKGVYVYKVKVTAPSGNSIDEYQKLVILN